METFIAISKRFPTKDSENDFQILKRKLKIPCYNINGTMSLTKEQVKLKLLLL